MLSNLAGGLPLTEHHRDHQAVLQRWGGHLEGLSLQGGRHHVQQRGALLPDRVEVGSRGFPGRGGEEVACSRRVGRYPGVGAGAGGQAPQQRGEALLGRTHGQE